MPNDSSHIVMTDTSIMNDSANDKYNVFLLGRSYTDVLDPPYKIIDEHAIVSVADIAGNILYANDAFCEISGYSINELIGNNHSILKSGEHTEEFYTDLWQTISDGKIWHGNIKNTKKCGGIYWVKTTIIPCFEANLNIDQYISIHTDITVQVEAEQTLRSTKDELERSNKLLLSEIKQHKRMISVLKEAKSTADNATNVKSEFLAHMSHELRTPLNAIIGYTQLLSSELHGPIGNTKYREYVDIINISGNRLHSLIGNVLDISKISSGDYTLESETFEIENMILESMKIVQDLAARAEVNLTSVIGKNVLDFEGDELHIRQIILNLLSNAIKFTPRGGEISVIAKLRDDNGLSIVIYDTGIGISPDDIEKVLKPFGQVRGSSETAFEGTGLGLSITKSLVELHDGTLTIYSNVGSGTLISARFPPERTPVQES